MQGPSVQNAPGWLQPGRRVYAIGDVHGMDDRLAALHDSIGQDWRHSPAQATLVHLGDYIDRGPDAAAVVHRLATPPIPGLPTVNLRGNHEQMMLDALSGDRDAIAVWRSHGARATLRSWRMRWTRPSRWQDRLPADDVAFLQALPLSWRCDGYLFVHAGVRPGVSLAEQTPTDLLWIRSPFLEHADALLPDEPSVAVVHGHTPEPAPAVTRNRIGVDTGAVRGGLLTCAVLEGTTVRFLTA